MVWNYLLTPNRFGKHGSASGNTDDLRSEFQRDYDRIIFSSPFRRMQNKTQVFPLPGSIFVHNRLTHSLEVASVGRSLGNLVFSKIEHQLNDTEKRLVREIDTLISTACLAHDLGNPPFGHSGEKAISWFFEKGKGSSIKEQITKAQYNDLVSFEGNANLFRLLTHQFKGRRAGGFALTYASLGAMVKYPHSSMQMGDKKKYGFFQSEKDAFRDVMEWLKIPEITPNSGVYMRHPLVYLVEAADDICYQLMDIEDAFKLGILPIEKVKELFLNFQGKTEAEWPVKIKDTLAIVSDPNEQVAFLRAMAINAMVWAAANVFAENYETIMNGSFKGKLLDAIETGNLRNAINICAEFSIKNIYKHSSVVKIEIAGYNVIGGLLAEFFDAISDPGRDYHKKLLSLMPEQFHPVSDDHYQRARSVVDFISGMTDVFAVDLYKQIKGIEL